MKTYDSVGTLSLTANGQVQKIRKGDFRIPKGKLAQLVLLKFVVGITKSDAGTTTLSAAQKLALLDSFKLMLKYGAEGKRIPYNGISLKKVRTLGLEFAQQEPRLYSDATDGLGKTIAASTTTNVTFYAVVPTGIMAKLKNNPMIGIGPSQGKSVELELRRDDQTIAANLTISATCTVDVVPECTPCNGDRFCYLPEYGERTESNNEQVLPDGLPHLVMETTAVHASTSLTDLDSQVGDELITRQASPTDIKQQLVNAPGYVSGNDVAAINTVLYAVPTGAELEQLPSGPYKFRNPSRNLTSYALAYVISPVVPDTEVAADIQFVADKRSKSVQGSTAWAVDTAWQGLPKRLRTFSPVLLSDSDDKEFYNFAGQRADPSGRGAYIAIPKAVGEAAAGAAARRAAAGEGPAAGAVVKSVATQIPGASSHGSGLAKGGMTRAVAAVADAVR